MKEYLFITELARRTRVSENILYQWKKDGWLKGKFIGQHERFTMSDFDRAVSMSDKKKRAAIDIEKGTYTPEQPGVEKGISIEELIKQQYRKVSK